MLKHRWVTLYQHPQRGWQTLGRRFCDEIESREIQMPDLAGLTVVTAAACLTQDRKRRQFLTQLDCGEWSFDPEGELESIQGHASAGMMNPGIWETRLPAFEVHEVEAILTAIRILPAIR
jgi:hypothetical protein